jgi:hypothetical protein
MTTINSDKTVGRLIEVVGDALQWTITAGCVRRPGVRPGLEGRSSVVDDDARRGPLTGRSYSSVGGDPRGMIVDAWGAGC